MTAQILGICRFSFLGQGDWIAARGRGGFGAERLASRSAQLYAQDRLARRFAVFERLMLPSLRAQTDRDFDFWLLTSPELPQAWLDRLNALVADLPRVRVLIAAERATEAALQQPLRAWAAEHGDTPLQFRLDDDDAISRHFIARLRGHAGRFADRQRYAISLANGLILRSYEGEGLSFWRAFQRFGSAGAAVKLADPDASVYGFNHFNIPRSLPAFSDVAGCNYIQLRWEMGDSAPRARSNWDSRHKNIGPEGFVDALEEDFPFLMDVDLGFILNEAD